MSARSVLAIPRPMRRRLELRRRKTRDAALARRITIVLLYAKGRGTTSIAADLGCAPRTAVCTVQRFRELSEDGLLDGRAGNGVSKIDPDLLEALAQVLDSRALDWGWERPTWTLELLARTLEAVAGVELSRTTVHRMLALIGARWGAARPSVACPWPAEKREARLRAIRRMIARLGPEEAAYYVDEVDIDLNPKIGRDWMPHGFQRRIPTPGKNQKGYLCGALEVHGRDFVHAEWPKKNADLFIALLGVLDRHLPSAWRIHLVLDNFIIHSCRKAKALLESLGKRFELHFLPPYCPDENKIERVWRDVHANVTRNHYCKTLAQLMSNVRRYIRSEANRRRALADPHLPRAIRRAA